jgi:ribosomal protein L23
MSSKPQRRPCLRFTQEQIDFVSKSEEKYKHIAQAFNATFERQITEKTVRAMRQRHGPYRGNHKWTAEQMTLVLNAEGTKGQIADAFKAKFNVEITHQNIRYLKTRYGPAAPLPDTDTGTHTRDQIRFVLDACEKLEHDNVPDRTKYAKVAEDYNTKFGTARKITDRGIRRIREQYGPALPFPCVHTDEQIQFILSENGKPAEVAKAYNARFNPKQKISVRAVKHLKDQHRSDLQLP